MPDEKDWFAVIGYESHVVVLDGAEYRANPVNMKNCIWLQAIDKSEAVPNAATAVYQATLKQIPSHQMTEVMQDLLEYKSWSLGVDIAESVEEVDQFLVESCGRESVFQGMVKVEDKYGDFTWESN